MFFKRKRRLRLRGALRDLVTETRLSIKDFIYPLFVVEGKGIRREIAALPGVFQLSIDCLLEEAKEVSSLGIPAVLLFGVPDKAKKDSSGSAACGTDSIIARSVECLRQNLPNLLVVVDLCFCEYTDHGHCGILDSKLGTVDNDLTLQALAKQALDLAKSGADVVAPSAMMDGQILSLRRALDEGGFSHIPLMSYSTKFASAYYGPFREVAQSTPSFGDRKSYQEDPANRREAILESLNDEEEGADIIMVKPALAYLDIIRDIREASLLPLAIYNVSGEYAMLKAAQKAGVIDYERVMLENMLAFKRAGADIIISYHAKEVARLI